MEEQIQQKKSDTVELPKNSLITSTRRRHNLLIMLTVGAFLTVSTVSAHQQYSNAIKTWEKAETLSQKVVKKENKKNTYTPMSDNTRALQQQVQQMKELIKRQNEIQKMEIDLFRYEMGMNQTQQKIHPTSQTEEKIHPNAEEDIDFARNIAQEAVQQEVEDFLDKVDLISKVGSYVAKRISD